MDPLATSSPNAAQVQELCARARRNGSFGYHRSFDLFHAGRFEDASEVCRAALEAVPEDDRVLFAQCALLHSVAMAYSSGLFEEKVKITSTKNAVGDDSRSVSQQAQPRSGVVDEGQTQEDGKTGHQNREKGQTILLDVERVKSSIEVFEFTNRYVAKQLSDSHPGTAVCHLNTGLLYLEAGDLEFAKEHFDWCLRILQHDFTPDRVVLADAYHNLACIHESEGNIDMAVAMYAQSLRVRQRFRDGAHMIDIALLRTMSNLAVALFTHPNADRDLFLFGGSSGPGGECDGGRRHPSQSNVGGGNSSRGGRGGGSSRVESAAPALYVGAQSSGTANSLSVVGGGSTGALRTLQTILALYKRLPGSEERDVAYANSLVACGAVAFSVAPWAALSRRCLTAAVGLRSEWLGREHPLTVQAREMLRGVVDVQDQGGDHHRH